MTGVVTGLGTVAVKTAADFDSAMSRVAASVREQRDLILSGIGQEMGAKTKFSATEAADAMNYISNGRMEDGGYAVRY
ncbi:MAG: hypothetical protein ACLU3F_07355 [Blautia wexlerae]